MPARDLASFDFTGLQLQLDGVGNFADAAQFFEPQRGLVVPVAAQRALALRNGQQLTWKLLRQGSDAPIAQGDARFSFAELKKTPLPQLKLEGANGDDMEGDIGNWKSSDAAVEADDETAATGARSLLLTNRRSASLFSTIVAHPAFDAAQFPVLTFAYRTDDRLRADLNFKWEGKPYSIRFTDRDNPNPRVAAIDAATDNQWHVATVDLLAGMKKLRPDATSFAIEQLEFADTKWLGNAKGVQLWLDDWRPAPLVSGAFHATVVSRDPSGVSGVAWIFDQKLDTQPAETSNGNADLKPDLNGKSGLWWLHVRTQDGAGKWSATAHFPFVVGTA